MFLFSIISAILVLLYILGSDVIFLMDGVEGNTYSELIRKAGGIITFIPWAWGGLGGHFFHAGWGQIIKSPSNIAIMCWLSVVITILGWGLTKSGFVYSNWIPYASFLLGSVAIGRLWPV